MFQAPLCPSSGAVELYRWLLPVVLGSVKMEPSTTGSSHQYNSRAPDDGYNGARNMLSKQFCNKKPFLIKLFKILIITIVNLLKGFMIIMMHYSTYLRLFCVYNLLRFIQVQVL